MSDNHVIEGESGTITLPGATLAAIVTRAAESVDGAKIRRRGVDVRVSDGAVHVRLDLNVRYGSVLPELGAAVQESVAGSLARMCGLPGAVVDLHVEELD